MYRLSFYISTRNLDRVALLDFVCTTKLSTRRLSLILALAVGCVVPLLL